MSEPRALRYRAGDAAARLLRDRGLTADTIAALVGPASGPKWIVLAGVDRALLDSGLLYRNDAGIGKRQLLVGASAGAWRMLALATRDPARTHRALLDGYAGMQIRPDRATPASVSRAYRSMLAGLFPPSEIDHLVAGDTFDIAVHTVRSRLPLVGSGSALSRGTQLLGLGAAAAAHTLSDTGVDRVFERVLFHSRPETFASDFPGRLVRLDRNNLLAAAAASGTVPIHMQPQRDPPGAPRGRYLDGGLTDYHLRLRYVERDATGVTLFPHFQRRIVPVWFDRSRRDRFPTSDALDHVLQLCPSDEFIASLPDGRLPDRDDFFRYATNPAERFKRWRAAAATGERLGAQLLEDLRSGRIPDLLEAFA